MPMEPATLRSLAPGFIRDFSRVSAASPPPIQSNLSLSQPGDAYEREADRTAERVMRAIQYNTPPDAGTAGLPGAEAASRAGYDLSLVRIHSDGQAARSAEAVGALAYTVGNHVVFANGRYAPHSREGQRLLAHELMHVAQQARSGLALSRQEPAAGAAEGPGASGLKGLAKDIEQMIPEEVMTALGGSFCQPFGSSLVAKAVRQLFVRTFVPAITATFGSEVGALWNAYLNRKPGDSLRPRRFTSPSSSIVRGFASSVTTREHQGSLIDRVKADLRGARLPIAPNRWVQVPIEQLLPADDLESTGPGGTSFSDIDFNQVFEIPGNIAGGVGESDAGPDERRVSGYIAFFRTTDASGRTTDARMKTQLSYRVFDTVDFCPLGTGNPGASIEQVLTVPLSMLEASGEAYDVPFEVVYEGPVMQETLDASLVEALRPAKPRAAGARRPFMEGLIGAGIAALVGTIIGGLLGGGVGALLGGGLGALAGGVVGYLLGSLSRRDPLADMSTLQSPGASGWRGAVWGCYRDGCTKRHKGWDIHAAKGLRSSRWRRASSSMGRTRAAGAISSG
jgi:hypothetical protein